MAEYFDVYAACADLHAQSTGALEVPDIRDLDAVRDKLQHRLDTWKPSPLYRSKPYDRAVQLLAEIALQEYSEYRGR